ncbi:MAG: lectin-like protein, partial [Candidatus Poribacteria bacterium]|nr:lectin-like protein [Candidatus Poribacteria bacterium]
MTSKGNADVFVAEIDEEGNWLTASSFGGPGSDRPYSVAADENGNIILGGTFEKTLTYRGEEYQSTGSGSSAFVALYQPYFDPEEGLVAYYPFNGNANDESGNGWHGTLQGATLAEDRNNKTKSAIEFNGSGVLNLGNSRLFQPVLNDDYTLISWIYLAEDQDSTFLSFGDDYGARSNQYIRLNVKENKRISVAIRGDSGEALTFGISTEKNAIKLNQWHLLHITKKKEEEGTNISLYIDGKRLINSTNYRAGKVNPRNNHNLILGADEVPRRRYFKGALDDLRLYNRALSEAEVATLYDLEKPESEAPESTYQIVEGSFTWHEAKADAEARGGHLAVITGQSEQNYINQIVKSGANYLWVGGTAEKGSWEWVTGEKWDYTNWSFNEPSSDGPYLSIWGSESVTNRDLGTWNDSFVEPSPNREGYLLE